MCNRHDGERRASRRLCPGDADRVPVIDKAEQAELVKSFVRYLESWGQPLYYNGSLVSMYYSEYNTGTYKDGPGGAVYAPPPRNYYFDVLFLSPSNLPPATPQFQDIDNLSYHQNFTPQ